MTSFATSFSFQLNGSEKNGRKQQFLEIAIADSKSFENKTKYLLISQRFIVRYSTYLFKRIPCQRRGAEFEMHVTIDFGLSHSDLNQSKK